MTGRDEEADDPRRRGTELFLRPDVVAALVVLIANDRVLKRRWPGWATGKLSDLAGLYLFPLVLVGVVEVGAVAVRRLAPRRCLSVVVATTATAAAFAAIKLVPAAGEAFQTTFGWLRWPLSALESRLDGDGFDAARRVNLVSDASDVLALPMAGLCWWVHGRSRSSPGAAPVTATEDATAIESVSRVGHHDPSRAPARDRHR